MKNNDRQKRVYISTFGCQMNDRDSEEITGMLLEKGYFLAESPEEADVALFNTCSVRKHAEERAVSNIGALKAAKKRRPHMIIGVVGCMAKAQGGRLFDKLPHVDFIAGPANIYEVPQIIERLVQEQERPTDFRLLRAESSALAMTAKGRTILAIDKKSRPEIKNIAYHTAGVSALVTIMEGCNNFCSYCIVPYVRGREVSRPSVEILKEAEHLAENGYKEITLLGQNVNSYRDGKVSFTGLLEKINRIDGIERIRFITSHPKDAGEDLFKAMRDLGKVCEHLHLPLQSGSDKILKAMNRGYTAGEFLNKAGLLKRYLPGCAVTTDVIVGYPGETEADFKATKRAMEEIGFSSAFIFKYSPRPPARSCEVKDDVPKEAKQERNQILLRMQEEISSKKEKEFMERDTEVLVERRCRKEKDKLIGRNRQNIKVALNGREGLIGELAVVKVKGVRGHTLVGGLMLGVLALFCAFWSPAASAAAADEYFVRGDYESAAKEAGRLLASTAKQADRLYYILGASFNKLGSYEAARQNFGLLLEKYPGSDYAHSARLGIADAYYLSGDYQSAGRLYEGFLRSSSKSGDAALAVLRLAKCAQKEGRWQEARGYFNKVKEGYPASFEAQLAEQALKEEMLYFTVQVGSFGRKANALRLCGELIKKNYDASILKSESEGRDTYRVRVGRLDRRQEAEALAGRLQAEGLPTNILP